MKKVLILMSTYNGKNYIRKQVESILDQKNVETNILIRDDGSNKETLDILKELKIEYTDRIDIIFGVVGLVLGLITLIVWRRMEHKAPIKLNGRMISLSVFGIVGALTLGVGMCFCMVWNNIILGTVIGLVGILLLLALIPITKGIK